MKVVDLRLHLPQSFLLFVAHAGLFIEVRAKPLDRTIAFGKTGFGIVLALANIVQHLARLGQFQFAMIDRALKLDGFRRALAQILLERGDGAVRPFQSSAMPLPVRLMMLIGRAQLRVTVGQGLVRRKE